jgi:HD-GYP domain-containing protein (c-di-GMP phosphodiesterase class II)
MNNNQLEIDNLEKIVEDLSSRLAGSLYQSIKVFSEIVARHERFYEGSHSRYVSQKSEEVAIRLGLSENEIFETKIGGLLHDIGKIGLNDSILSKFNSELLEFEYNQYVMHSQIGWLILKNLDGLESIAEIVYQHHERIDGFGFPRRLKAKEILMPASIISVVDTFHNIIYKKRRDRTNTLTSTLNYSSTSAFLESTRARFSSALNFIHQKTDSHFNRKIVEVFIDIIDEERHKLGEKTIMRIAAQRLEPGMVFAEDYYSSSGMLIVARGESFSEDNHKALMRFVENEEIPMKILVFR